ncbi:hypothetical protein [Maribacter cobaltidurans]|uniref:Uncharacterized protein n=1 Tax=Maribacter cobaltidurans TaxID=1178778 RepID=A0A223V5C6_9FLAO|nr:hypothetical protein [Maribacter cobaltidurans]ASV30218.1 hypothetical protein CJ263_08295 [Maribacter cobaltidurans]GGD76736.1 hypothetical protein GCM10011412_13130 [Maribacter cobaltidurans]
MKYIIPLCIILFASSSNNDSFTKNQQDEFEQVAKNYQKIYMDGNANCDEILSHLDENIIMSEAQFGGPNRTITYDQLKMFCPHLPQKEVIGTITEQRLLATDLGYDYVSQIYLRKSVGDTARETSARIWERKKGVWKIIQMNNSLRKECN